MGGSRRGDRAQRIAATAAKLFRERGFHATSIDDIGRAEGISGPALYRHYAGKDDLLAAATRRGVEHITECLDSVCAASATDPVQHLTNILRAAARALIDDLDAIVVYLRERRHLSAAERREIGALSRHNDLVFIDAVQAVRPELSRHHVGFMLQSLTGLYVSISHFQTRATRARLEDLLTLMGTAALLDAPDRPVSTGRTPWQARRTNNPRVVRASRREIILAEATSLFRQHGYASVGVDDIGEAAGIAGPGVYRHFRNKEDVLAAAMLRASEQLAASASKALAASGSADALGRLIDSYVELAIENDDAIAVYLAEVSSLSDANRRAVRRSARSYLEEWEQVIADLAPQQNVDDVRVAVNLGVGLINGYAEGAVRPPVEVAKDIVAGMTTAAFDAFIASTPAT